MPIDNLSVDANGDLFAAAFPNALKLITEIKNVAGVPVPATVWQIRKGKEEENSSGAGNYLVWKVLEDRETKVLPSGTTTAVHDAKTGRIFLGGVISDHITVCEPLYNTRS
jgi:arylesterase/paraoxonase